MTQFTRRRRKKQRFYWVELGFLLLGIIGLKPEILTELLPSNRANVQSLSQLPTYNTLYVPVQALQPVLQQPYGAYQPLYQVAQQPTSQAYSLYGAPNQQQVHQQLAQQYTSPYDPTRVASNPSQVTSRYNAAPGYSSGSVSSYSSYPPVVWPEGYQPGGNHSGMYQANGYPTSGSNYYRR